MKKFLVFLLIFILGSCSFFNTTFKEVFLETHLNTFKNVKIYLSNFSKVEATAFEMIAREKLCHFICRIAIWNDSVLVNAKIKKIIITKSTAFCRIEEENTGEYILFFGDYFFLKPIPFYIVEIFIAHEMGHIIYDQTSEFEKICVKTHYQSLPQEVISLSNEQLYLDPNLIPVPLGHADDGPEEYFASMFVLTDYFAPVLLFETDMSFRMFVQKSIKPFQEQRQKCFHKAVLCEMW